MTTDYEKVHEKFETHRLKNKIRNRSNWRSIVRYLADGPKSSIPKSFQSGMEIWKSKIKPLSFSSNPPKNDNNNQEGFKNLDNTV